MAGLAKFASAYFTDFGEYSIGEADDWQQTFGAFRADIVVEPGSLSGNKLAMTAFASAGTRRWTRIPDHADLEIYAVVQLPSSNILSNFTSYARTAIRMSSDGGVYYLLSWDKSNARIKIERGDLPARDTLLSAAAKEDFAPGAILALRFRARGTELSGKIWLYAHPEPEDWDIQVRDEAITFGGVGYRKNHADGTDAYWWYGVGVGGASAPQPSNNSVTWGP